MFVYVTFLNFCNSYFLEACKVGTIQTKKISCIAHTCFSDMINEYRYVYQTLIW